MQVIAVFGLLFLVTSLRRQGVVMAQKEDQDSDGDAKHKDAGHSPIEQSEESTRSEALPSGHHVITTGASICDWPCVKCVDDGTGPTCASCERGFRLSVENACIEAELDTEKGDIAAGNKRVFGATAQIVTASLGFAFCGLMALFVLCRRRERVSESHSPSLSPVIDSVREISLSTSQEAISGCSSSRIPSESVFVIVQHPNDDFVVGVKGKQAL